MRLAGDDIDLQTDEFRYQVREPLDSPLRRATLDDKGLALHVAELPQAFKGRSPESQPGNRRIPEIPDTGNLPRLCLAHERRNENAQGYSLDEIPGGRSLCPLENAIDVRPEKAGG
jgi:hypothetical protein